MHKDNPQKHMSSIRMTLFPVMNQELGRFIPMAIMVFFTIFSFSLLRNFKDALITYAPGSAAEVLPFLKAYVVLPCSIAASLMYMKLRKSVDFTYAYYAIVSIFICIFAIFAVLLYPNVAYIHPSKEYLTVLQEAYPRLQFLFPIWANWSYSLFYVAAELWGTFALSVLFWQFANNTTSPEEAKRFYPLYALAGNIGLILLEPIINIIKQYPDNDVYQVCGISILSGIALIVTFWYTNNIALPTARAAGTMPDLTPKKKTKKKLSFVESLKVLFKSEYIGYIALLVLSYGMIINLLEAVWKAQVRSFFTDRISYLTFMGKYTSLTGWATIMMIYTSKGILRRFGWVTGALVTPVVCGVFSSLFFVYVLNQEFFASMLSITWSTMFISVWFGAYSVLLSKGSKYSFFDPTKEMAFIPLDSDLKTNGKAAVDGVGGRLGKSAGGLIVTQLLIITGVEKIIDIAHFLGGIVILLTIGWLFSVLRLNKLYLAQLKQSEEENQQPEDHQPSSNDNKKTGPAYA